MGVIEWQEEIKIAFRRLHLERLSLAVTRWLGGSESTCVSHHRNPPVTSPQFWFYALHPSQCASLERGDKRRPDPRRPDPRSSHLTVAFFASRVDAAYQVCHVYARPGSDLSNANKGQGCHLAPLIPIKCVAHSAPSPKPRMSIQRAWNNGQNLIFSFAVLARTGTGGRGFSFGKYCW